MLGAGDGRQGSVQTAGARVGLCANDGRLDFPLSPVPQDSTLLYEVLPDTVMDACMTLTNTITRIVIKACNGYESATEVHGADWTACCAAGWLIGATAGDQMNLNPDGHTAAHGTVANPSPHPQTGRLLHRGLPHAQGRHRLLLQVGLGQAVP